MDNTILTSLILLGALVVILGALITAFILGFRMGRVVIGKAIDITGSSIKKTSQHIISEPDLFEEATNKLEDRADRVPTMRQ